MTTRTVTLFPIIGALNTAHAYKGQATGPWQSTNDKQKAFLERMKACSPMLEKFTPAELKYFASSSDAEINAWLTENGFDIKLAPFVDPQDYGAAAIQDVQIEWMEEANSNVMQVDDEIYPSVTMRKDNICYKQNIAVHPHPVAKITTKNGDVVMMTVATEELEGTELLDKVTAIFDGTSGRNDYRDFDDLMFPKIDLNDKPDIGWLIGMGFPVNISGSENFGTLSQALQQTFFKMNEVGARVKSAVAVGVMFECCSCPSPPLVMDKPFYLSIIRPGVDVPYFAAYLDVDSWKNPGSLKMKGDKE